MKITQVLLAAVSSVIVLAETSTAATIFPINATSSSLYSGSYNPNYAIDNNNSSRWSSIVGPASDPSWIMINLGDLYSIGAVKIDWERASSDYTLRVSADNTPPSPTTNLSAWTTVATVIGQNEPNIGSGGPDETFDFTNGTFTDNAGTGVTSASVANGSPIARYILLYSTSRSSIYGHSIWEISVTGTAVPEPTSSMLAILGISFAAFRRRSRVA